MILNKQLLENLFFLEFSSFLSLPQGLEQNYVKWNINEDR